MTESACKNPTVARPAIAPEKGLPALSVAAFMSVLLFLTALMPLLVPKEARLEVLNTTAWVAILGGFLFPGALWALALHPEGPRVPAPWTQGLFQGLLVHLSATMIYVVSVVLFKGYAIGNGYLVMTPGVCFSITALYCLFQAKGAISENKALIPGFVAILLAWLLHLALVLRFGPDWRVNSLQIGAVHLNTIQISHLLLPAGVLAIFPVKGVKPWSQVAVAGLGFFLAIAFVVQSSSHLGGKFTPLLHASGTFGGLLLLHRFAPRKNKIPDSAGPMPSYLKPIRLLQIGGFLFLLASIVLAFVTMVGPPEAYPRMRQAHFHANTLGFLTAWILAHQYQELEGLIASDKSGFLVLDSQKGFVMAASVLTLLGGLFLTIVFFFPVKPHAISGIGGLCTMAASLLWVRMFLMGRVMMSRKISPPGGSQ